MMPRVKVWVVIPTYNERASVGSVIDRITTSGSYHILVVDDNSPDGTGDYVRSLATKYPELELFSRHQKMGLGAAYDESLRYALKQGAETIIHLDADGSHPPELIPELLDYLQRSDLVLASRYVHGGSMRIDPWRRLVSGMGNIYIRAMLGGEIRDWSTGFKAWRAELLRRVLTQPLRSTGYAWLMETTWYARRLGATIVERPLKFEARMGGHSKFNYGIVYEDIFTAWHLHQHKGLPKK